MPKKVNLNRILDAVNTLSDCAERKIEEDIKDIKNLFILRKEIGKSAT